MTPPPPPYYTVRFQSLSTGAHAKEVATFEAETGMTAERPLLAPFLHRGSPSPARAAPAEPVTTAGKVLFLGLAPHSSKSKPRPPSANVWFSDNCTWVGHAGPGQTKSGVPNGLHRMHQAAGRCAQAILEGKFRGFNTAWMDDNYLTADLVPYHIKRWKLDRKWSPTLLSLVTRHVKGVESVVAPAVGAILATGRAWEQLFITNPPSTSLPRFQATQPRQYLAGPTGIPKLTNVRLHIGTLSFGGRNVRTAIVSSLLHRTFGLTNDGIEALGSHLHGVWP